MKKYFITLCLISLCISTQAFAATSAKLSLSYDEKQLAEEGRTFVSLYLSPNEDNINALEGDIVISAGSGTISDIEDGNSIVSAWIERPVVKDNSIRFAGIIPGGFNGIYSPFEKDKLPGLVFRFMLGADAPGDVAVNITNFKAYKGAGEDSFVEVDPSILNIRFLKETSLTSNQLIDIVPPSDLTAEVVKLGNEIEGWFVIFSARDNESGIDHFEYQESLTKDPSQDQWERVESPVRLKDQSRRHYILVKAVDRSGNIAVLAVAPQSGGMPEYIYGALALAIILLVTIIKLFRVRV